MPDQIHLAPTPTEPTQLEMAYPNEVNRWILTIGLPMLAACICVGLGIGTRFHWFYGGAIAFGPGLGVLAIIYLSISSDTNGTSAQPAIQRAAQTRQPESAATTAAA